MDMHIDIHLYPRFPFTFSSEYGLVHVVQDVLGANFLYLHREERDHPVVDVGGEDGLNRQ